jgi:hypothetical protein
MLLDYGAEVDREIGQSGTALVQAAAYGARDAVELLLDYGADIYRGWPDGMTPCSATNGRGFPAHGVDPSVRERVVQALMSQGTEVRTKYFSPLPRIRIDFESPEWERYSAKTSLVPQGGPG